jgi:hypothetical protein
VADAAASRLLAGALVACVLAVPAGAQTSAAGGAGAVLRSARTAHPIRLDGVPDEPVWLAADSVTDFRQQDPQEGAPGSERTVLRIVAGADALYLAFWCYDREPGAIRRTQLRRDFDTDADDFVAFLLDPQGDRRSGVYFAVNPNGAMLDGEVIGFEDSNDDWDGVWDARARVTADGWTAEVAIPWQALRYPLTGGAWGFNAGRVIRRRNETVLWQAWLRQQGFFFQEAQGTLEVPPDLPPRRPFEGMPYVSAELNGDTRTWLPSGADSVTAPGSADVKVGFDGKLAVAPRMNLDITVNTDFAQVEADQQVVNLTRFPLFFPEKRDFFLESSGIFDFGSEGISQLFHSRRIGLDAAGNPIPIVAGLRLTGRAGAERVGLLAVRTGDGEDALDVVGRVKHDVFSRGYVGAMGTVQGGPGIAGTRLAGGVDASIPTVVGNGQNLVVAGWAMWSRDSAGAATPGSWNVVVDYPNDNMDHFLSVMQVDGGFDPALGFVRQDGIRRLNTAWRFTPRPGRWGVRRLNFNAFSAEVTWRMAGGVDHARYSVRPLGVEFESGDEVLVNLYHLDDAPTDTFDIAGVPVPPGTYGYNRGEIEFSTADSRPVSVGLEVSFGRFYGGNAVSLEYDASVRVAPHVTAGVEGGVDRGTLPAGDFSAQAHRLRFDWASNPRLNTTLFLQWDSESDRMAVNARLHWIPRPGVDAYLVWNSAWPTALAGGVPWERPLRSGLIGKFVYYFRM